MFVRLSADQMGFTRITESKPHRISPGYKRRKRVQKPSPNSCSRMPRLPELLFLILRTNINADNLAENAMRRVALGRRNWIHIGSEEAGPRVAAIVFGCSFWTLRFAACSSGASLNRRSFSWRSAGICASRFRTATSRSYWPSVGSRWITSPSGAGSSGTLRSWIGACANGSRQQTTLGGWWTPAVRRSTSFSRLNAMQQRLSAFSPKPCA